MSGFRRVETPREQMVLWATRLDEAVPADHPVRMLEELLRAEAFANTFQEWEGEYQLDEGQPPYHPRDLAGLYLYGMLNRIRSSRQLEAACWNRLDVIWLLQGQHPDHSTIAAFVTDHGKPLKALFRNVLAVGIRAGLIKAELVAVDGTKIEADAGRDSVRQDEKIRSWLGHLDERIAAMEAEWAQNEQKETALWGDSVPWSPSEGRSLPQRLAAMKRQQERLRKALQEVERRAAEASASREAKAIASTTDPDSRCMKDKEGRSKPNYNAQLAVDASAGMIVAENVNDQPSDSGQLSPMIEQVELNCGIKPAAACADSQYNTGPELAALETQEVTAYLPDAGASEKDLEQSTERQAALEAVREGRPAGAETWAALPRGRDDRFTRDAFVYDAAGDTYRCPPGFVLTLQTTNTTQRGWGQAIRKRYGFDRGAAPCAQCAQAALCCSNLAQGRRIDRDQYEENRERLRARMKGEAGQAIYKRRKETVEPRIGLIKAGLGVRRFLRRGLDNVRREWTLVCTTVNLGILLRHWHAVRPAL